MKQPQLGEDCIERGFSKNTHLRPSWRSFSVEAFVFGAILFINQSWLNHRHFI